MKLKFSGVPNRGWMSVLWSKGGAYGIPKELREAVKTRMGNLTKLLTFMNYPNYIIFNPNTNFWLIQDYFSILISFGSVYLLYSHKSIQHIPDLLDMRIILTRTLKSKNYFLKNILKISWNKESTKIQCCITTP